MDLVEKLARGDKAATARAISIVENNESSAEKIMKSVFKLRREARVIGITGPSGVGKSCLVDRLIEAYRSQHKTVGVIAVDPTSPFTGGAILGDRIRMQRHSSDDGVFIRSLGSRGSLGGLSQATKSMIDILSASSKDVILLETVGIGQVEVDVARYADTVVIVLVPELGDGVQALKAGLLEIGDVFVINKADHEGAERAMMLIRESLTYSGLKGWRPPVLVTVATTGKGVRELVREVEKHWKYLADSGLGRERKIQQAESEVLDLVRSSLSDHLKEDVATKRSFRRLMKEVATHQLDPRSAARRVLQELFADR